MRKKVAFILVAMFAVQIIASCCNSETYELTITGLESRALILDGNIPIYVTSQNPINKEDLIIEVLVTGTEQIASTFEKEFSKLGFQNANAAVVPCEDQVLILKNKILSLTIKVLDTNTNLETDVTNQFVIQGTPQISIVDYLTDNALTVNNGFLIQLSNTNNIPNQAQFIIDAVLDDNQNIGTVTNQISFN